MMTIKGGMRPREERERIQSEYFEWIVQLVNSEKRPSRPSYNKLFRLLHDTEFIYILDMDENRANDGLELRYRFAYENGLDENKVRDALDDRPCSLLEMMAALAKRCEEHITGDPDSEDQTERWFFEMIDSLGLRYMDDDHFVESDAVEILNVFMRREYLPDGRGGLFTVPDAAGDMRTIEIWYQMMIYLNEMVYGRRNS